MSVLDTLLDAIRLKDDFDDDLDHDQSGEICGGRRIKIKVKW